jgi:serine/threonine protein kinase
MAPEVLLLASYKGSALEAAVSKRVGEKMDVWSLGVCLFELAAGTGQSTTTHQATPLHSSYKNV